LDVAAPLALGAGTAAASTLPTGELVDRRVEPLGDFELFADLGFMAAFPPSLIGMGEGVLPGWLGGACRRDFVHLDAVV
jgi:hypothetical protein